MNEIFELVLRVVFALQMIFWGLNGFFNWFTIPAPSPIFERFVEACIEVRFLMPFVKVLEILLGISLLLNFSSSLCLALFAPLMFVITGLHAFHNPRPWGVLIPLVLPYAVLWFFHGVTFLRLLQ